MSSGIETHENGESNIEIDESTVAEDEMSKSIVLNDHVQDYNVSPNSSSSVGESSINSYNEVNGDNTQVKPSSEQMKEMLANRSVKKLTTKIPVDCGKKFSHQSDLDFCERILDCMEKQDNPFKGNHLA